jgi:hypothetical protein
MPNSMTFTEKQQVTHRKAFIEECRQKAWGAACHADWISKGLDELLAHYGKLKQEDGELEAKIKEAETALDYHTVENRNKRKAMQERRNALARQMQFMLQHHEEARKAMQNLYQSIESNLALAKHADGWEWKEVGRKN